MKQYLLALSPDIDITPEEFVQTWNSVPEAREKAWASYEPDVSRAYNLNDIINLAIAFAGGIATNALYDLIKMVIVKILAAKAASKKEALDQHNLKSRIKISKVEIKRVLIEEITIEKED
jgi:hypothetical protein